MKKLIYLIISLCLIFITNFPSICVASRLYVDPTNGNNNYNGRDINFPIQTLNTAGYLCVNGDTIFILGSYHTGINQDFTRTNDTTGWVYIMPYSNGLVTLDGSGAVTDFWDAIITIESTSRVYIKRFNLINSTGQNEGIGLRVNSYNRESRNIIVDSCKINNTKRQGINVQASYTTVKNCEISNACLSNINQSGCSSYWDAALKSYVDVTRPWLYCYKIEFYNNKIHNCWGEGINLVRTDSFKVYNNTVYNVYSQSIYLDNSYNGEVNNNWLYSNDSTYDRSCYNHIISNNYKAPAGGIYWAAEGYGNYEVDRIVENIKIYNNFIYGTSNAFGWFRDDGNSYANNSYKNIQIFYNTVYNLKCYETFYLEIDTLNRTRPSGCIFRNNILPKGRYLNQISSYVTNSADFVNYWTRTNNCFIDNDIPANWPNNIQGDPSFINPGINLPDYFKLASNSICRDSGISISGITSDYWYAGRDNTPCIGFHEYGGISKILYYGNEIPDKITLSQNYPNPFNPITKIRFGIPSSQRNMKSVIRFTVFDVLGREAAVLINDYLQPGNYEVFFDGSNFASGIYFYTLQTGALIESRRMLLIK
jgi:hypothetical protein